MAGATSEIQRLYTYNGPIERFGKWVGNWRGQTYAATAAKAKSNLTYQARQAMGLTATAPLKLTGKVVEFRPN